VWLTGLLVFATMALVGRPCLAALRPDETVQPRVDAAIFKGLAFLAKQQNPDGSLDGGAPKVATTSLSLLAFLSAGHTPDLGRYGLVLRSQLDFLLAKQAEDGYFGNGDRGMYSHAITTLALSEAYGVETSATRRARLHTALTKAVSIILAAQDVAKSNPTFAGGWRYERNSSDSDLSLSGWNVLALRAARDVGIDVPEQNRKKAGEFVLRCLDPGTRGFAYQPGSAAQAGDTAIGLVCLHLTDTAEANATLVGGALKFLQTHPIDGDSPFSYYATYYVTLAASEEDGDGWVALGRTSLERLVRTQEKDGSWPLPKNSQEPGRVYATAMAVGALAMPYRLLPVHQR
jgi:hypothetical protein